MQSSHPNPSSDFTPFHKWWKLTKHDQPHPHPIHPHASGVAGPARQVHPGIALRMQRQPQLRQRHAARGVRGSLQASKQRRGGLRVSPNGGRSPEWRLGGLGGWEERNDFFGAFGKFKKPSNVGRLKTLCFRGLDSKDMPRSVSCRIDLLIFSDHCPIVGVAYVPTTQR